MTTDTPPDLPPLEHQDPELEQLLDAEAIAQSFTGFDEIAIRQAFTVKDLSDLGETTQMRACWFIHRRRQGLLDVDAYREAMTSTLGELVAKFRKAGDDDPEG